MSKIVTKSVQTSFGAIFSKKFFDQCSMEGRVFEKIQNKSKNFQNSKNGQNCSQKRPNVFWTCFGLSFSKKNFLPSVPCRVESSKIFRKIENI